MRSFAKCDPSTKKSLAIKLNAAVVEKNGKQKKSNPEVIELFLVKRTKASFWRTKIAHQIKSTPIGKKMRQNSFSFGYFLDRANIKIANLISIKTFSLHRGNICFLLN